MSIAPTRISYEYINGTGILKEPAKFVTPIKGVVAVGSQCTLFHDGLLLVKPGFIWDFGTGAIDTPDVVIASLMHDAFCQMTDSGVLEWKYRKVGDALYRKVLKEKGMSFWRRWLHYGAVRIYSLIKKGHKNG